MCQEEYSNVLLRGVSVQGMMRVAFHKDSKLWRRKNIENDAEKRKNCS